MAVQLFRLRNVPDDEAQEIRDLLGKNKIDYYETPAGNWGISMPAIWLRDDDELERAKELIESYQNLRFEKAKNEKQRSRLEGRSPNLLTVLLASPIQTIIYTALAFVILYFSIKPFLNFGQ